MTLSFTDFLDPRVRSRLGQLDIVFNPYDAAQLQDILRQRSEGSLKEEILDDGVIALCAAFSCSRTRGCALVPLICFAYQPKRLNKTVIQTVAQRHVRMAQHQIERDQMIPVISSLPSQQKLVLASVLLNEKNGLRNIQTGEVYDVYQQACRYIGHNALTQRRVSGLISNLDMLGLIYCSHNQ